MLAVALIVVHYLAGDQESDRNQPPGTDTFDPGDVAVGASRQGSHRFHDVGLVPGRLTSSWGALWPIDRPRGAGRLSAARVAAPRR